MREIPSPDYGGGIFYVIRGGGEEKAGGAGLPYLVGRELW